MAVCVISVCIYSSPAEHQEKPGSAPSAAYHKRPSSKPQQVEKPEKPGKPEKPPKPTDLLQAAGALYGNVERDMNTEVKVADLSKYVTERTLDEGFKKEYTVSGTPLSACFYSAVQYSDRCTNLFCTMYNLFEFAAVGVQSIRVHTFVNTCNMVAANQLCALS